MTLKVAKSIIQIKTHKFEYSYRGISYFSGDALYGLRTETLLCIYNKRPHGTTLNSRLGVCIVVGCRIRDDGGVVYIQKI